MPAESRIVDMERELAQLNTILSRLDASVEKLTSISSDVTQLLAVHENRLTFQEKMHDALLKAQEKADAKLESVRDEMYEEIARVEKDTLTKISTNATKISSLQQWMWTILGGGGALIFFIDKIAPLLGIG